MRCLLGNGNISPAESSQGSYWVVSASMPRPLHRDLNENPYGPPVSWDPSLIMSCFVLWSSHRIQWSLPWVSTSRRTGRIDRQLWGHLFTDEETEHLLQLESAAQSRQATAFFSIKEAFYKYQFPDNARLGRIQRRHRSSRRRIVLSIVGTDQRCNSGTQCPCRRRACWHRSDHCLSR